MRIHEIYHIYLKQVILWLLNVLWRVSLDSLWFKAVCCVCVLAGGEREKDVLAISKWVMNVCKGDGLDMGRVKNVSNEGWLYRGRVRQI